VVSCWPFSGDRDRPSPRLPPSPYKEHRIGAPAKDGALVTVEGAKVPRSAWLVASSVVPAERERLQANTRGAGCVRYRLLACRAPSLDGERAPGLCGRLRAARRRSRPGAPALREEMAVHMDAAQINVGRAAHPGGTAKTASGSGLQDRRLLKGTCGTPAVAPLPNLAVYENQARRLATAAPLARRQRHRSALGAARRTPAQAPLRLRRTIASSSTGSSQMVMGPHGSLVCHGADRT
jgi:hypothetical protein